MKTLRKKLIKVLKPYSNKGDFWYEWNRITMRIDESKINEIIVRLNNEFKNLRFTVTKKIEFGPKVNEYNEYVRVTAYTNDNSQSS